MGALLAICSAFLNSFNSVQTKTVLKNVGFKEGIFYSMFFSAALAFPVALINWRLQMSLLSVCIILLTSVAQAITICIGNYLIKEQGISSSNVYLKVSVLLSFGLDFMMQNSIITIYKSVGLILFLTGLALFVSNKNELTFVKNKKNALLILLNVLIFSIRPFFVKWGYSEGCFNGSTLVFINFALVCFYFKFIFKIKFKLSLGIAKDCGFKSLIKTLGSFTYNASMNFTSVGVAQAFSSLDIVFTPIMARFILKERVFFKHKIAIALIFIGVGLLR